MCYHVLHERTSVTDQQGVRELRRTSSLRRVRDGAILEVTERGTPVARLLPLPPKSLSPLERLIAEGRAQPATRSHRSLPPQIRMPGVSVSRFRQQMRDEDDR
jgi:antitoxin (DNA-binding transcriptional repressor) of toxin-antitoxin stability system